MFGFFNEIKNKYKDTLKRVAPYQYVLVGNFLLYVEGFCNVMTYTNETLVIKVKDGILTIKGVGLVIKEMSPSTITISGKIVGVEAL